MGRQRRIALDVRGLIDRVDIFRLSRGARRDPAVEAWLNEGPDELRSLAARWFAQMRRCGGDVRELMHDGCPVACVEDAPFGYVNSFRNHVNVGFFYGALLQDPAGLLQGTGKRMRHVKLRPGVDLDVAALRGLIDAAYTDLKARLAAER
jgi:hypothetical protein